MLTNCADVANFVFARKTGDCFDLTGQIRVYDNFNDPILKNITDASGSTRLMGVRHVVTPVPFKSFNGIPLTVDGLQSEAQRKMGVVHHTRSR